MAPSIATSNVTLTYPIYASSFDARNSDFLVVGGGGGEGRSGVGNKITLLDASKKNALSEVVDIDLSRDEDSVTSLAVAKSDEDSAIVYAGINSSEKDALQGRNEHLRAFRLNYPAKRRKTSGDEAYEKSGSKIEPLGKAALFEAAKSGTAETYQRVLRVSPLPQSGSDTRIGTISTGLAPKGELVIFDASKDAPTQADVLRQIQLGDREEAADIDSIADKDCFLIAYCTDYEVYLCSVALSTKGKTKSREPRLLHAIPLPDAFVANKRSQFRCIRFLTPQLLAIVVNLPGRSGVEILLVEIPEERALEGRVLLRKRLQRSTKSATGMAVATLPASTPTQNIQHVIAIAGHDISLTILTLDHSPSSHRGLSFGTYSILRDVHPLQITSVALSTFIPPSDTTSAAGPQYLKLASTSMSSTVVVHTLPLTPYPPFSKKEPARYTLLSPGSQGELAQMSFSVLVAIIMVALGAFVLQAFTEIRGGTPDYLGAKGWLSKSLHDKLARPYMFADTPVIVASMPTVEGLRAERTAEVLSSGYEAIKSSIPDAEAIKSSIPDAEEIISPLPIPVSLKEALLQRSSAADADGQGKALVIRDGEQGLSTEFHEDESVLKENARKWEDLEQHEKSAWLERLEAAGHWTVETGESVLKGIFFSEIAGAVVEAIQG